MTRPTRFAVIVTALASALALTGCSAQQTAATSTSSCTPAHKFSTVHQGTLTVQIVPSLPYIDQSDDGTLTGIDGDIVKAIAKRECLTVNVNSVTAAVAISGITGGQADVAAGGWYNTTDRGKQVGQTDTMYYDFTGVVSKGGTISTVAQLKEKNIGVIEGSLFVAELQKLIGAEHVKQYKSTAAVIDDIQNGRIDAGLTGSGEGGYIVKQRKDSGLKLSALKPDASFSPSQSAGKVNLPHTKTNTALGEALNADIDALRADGTVQEILTKWGLTSPENFEQ